MSAVERVLIVGGGASGAASAILLAEGGVHVDLVEAKSDVSGAGSGITLLGSALRVLRELGVWESVRDSGYSFDSLGLRAPDEHGTLLADIPDFRTGGPDLPATCGAVRPVLARILIERAMEVGANVHFSSTVTSFEQDDEGVDVVLADGSRERYDLVIGADGLRSSTRSQLGIDLQTSPTGMGIWRIFGARPASVTRTDLIYGGSSYIAGYCPTSPDTLYAYIVEALQDRSSLTPQQQLETVRELSGHYHGPWDEIRDGLTDPSRVNYTKFESHLLGAPWHRGRVVLVGDAVHACPPTLALGAAMALEDASVLSELLHGADTLDSELLDRYAARRMPRAELVVTSSVQLVQWLLDHDPAADVEGLMRRVNGVVSDAA